MTRISDLQSGMIAVLDIGTAKTVCLIAARNQSRSDRDESAGLGVPYRILGVGHQQSRGIKAGVVIDLAEAEASIRGTIAQAERMAGVTLDRVYVAVSCGRLKSHSVTASIEIGGTHVTARDLSRLMSGARAYIERDGRRLVHLNRKAVHLDGTANGGALIGMVARQMSTGIHAVSADEAPIRNLTMVLERCHVGIAGLVAAPYASALAATSEEERQLGITVIDIGAGTTKLAAYSNGHLEHVRSIPFGSGLITTDIARALHTPLIEAERIKVLYGNLLSARSDEHEEFLYPSVNTDDGPTQHATRAQLASIIRPRTAEILQAVASQLDRRQSRGGADASLVLTGGGSLLNGMPEFACDVLQRSVRRAQPAEVSGLPPVACTPAFSTAIGLLLANSGDQDLHTAGAEPDESEFDGYFQRVGAWLKSGF